MKFIGKWMELDLFNPDDFIQAQSDKYCIFSPFYVYWLLIFQYVFLNFHNHRC